MLSLVGHPQPTRASATCSSPKYHGKDWLPSACTGSTEESSKARILGMPETPVFQSILGFKEEGNLPATLFQLPIPSTPFFQFSLLHFTFPSQLDHAPFQPSTDPKLPTFPSSPSPAAPSQKPNFCSHSTMKNLTKIELFLFLTMDSIAWELKSHLGSTSIRLFENITQNLSKIANTKVREAGMVRRRQ